MMEQWHNKVIEGDCLEVMSSLPACSIDMILCDLPYGQTHNPWDRQIDLDCLWKQYARIIKETGVIVLTSQGLFTSSLISSNPSWFRYKLVWIKSKATNFLNAKKQPLRKHEDICIFYKKPGAYQPQMMTGSPYRRKRKQQHTGSYNSFAFTDVINSGHRYPVDVIYFKTAEAEGAVVHPNQKPVALGQYLVRMFSRPAVKEGRRFIGIEKNENAFRVKTKPVDFVAIARQRTSAINNIIN